MFSSRSARPVANTTSRRRLLGGGATGAVGLAALSFGMSHRAGSAPPTASAQSGPWAGGDVPLAARSSRQMSVAARAFLNGLGADQLSNVQYPDLRNPARTQWSNLPSGASPRPGVSIGDFSDSQRVLLHELLRASTSSQAT